MKKVTLVFLIVLKTTSLSLMAQPVLEQIEDSIKSIERMVFRAILENGEIKKGERVLYFGTRHNDKFKSYSFRYHGYLKNYKKEYNKKGLLVTYYTKPLNSGGYFKKENRYYDDNKNLVKLVENFNYSNEKDSLIWIWKYDKEGQLKSRRTTKRPHSKHYIPNHSNVNNLRNEYFNSYYLTDNEAINDSIRKEFYNLKFQVGKTNKFLFDSSNNLLESAVLRVDSIYTKTKILEGLGGDILENFALFLLSPTVKSKVFGRYTLERKIHVKTTDSVSKDSITISFKLKGQNNSFESSILKEIDFINESINVQRFYNNLEADTSLDQFAKAPKVYPEFTTSKVLALEFISGTKINQIDTLKAKDHDIEVIARRLAVSYFKQIFEYGFFHADPHPGNLLVLPNNHICYLDFGMMGSMLPRDISIFGKLFIAITEKDVKRIIQALQQLSNNAPIKDMRLLEFDINEFVEKYYVRDIHDNEMSTILLELKDIIIGHGLKVPTYFFLFARSLVTLEGVINKLYPGMEQFDIVRPYLKRSATRKYNPVVLGKKVANSIIELTDYMEEFPKDLKNAIRKINSGEVKVDLTHKGIDPMVHTLQRITKQLITAFIMVALIVGASLFIIFEITPLWNGISVLGMMSFVIAVILGFGMLMNISKGDYDT